MELQILTDFFQPYITGTQLTSHKEPCSSATQQCTVVPHDDALVGTPRVFQLGRVHFNPDYHSLMIGPSAVTWRREIHVHEALVPVQGCADCLLVVIVISHNGFTREESDAVWVGVLVLGRL